MKKIYMLQTLELIAKSEMDKANDIVANSNVVKSEKAGVYFILNDNYSIDD